MTRPNPKNRNRAVRWLSTILLVSGIAALAVWAGSLVVPAVWQAWQNRAFDRARSDQANAIKPPQAPGLPKALPRPQRGSVVGRLSIPRLQLSSMVREGDDETTLSLALGHIPTTVLPGERGNVAVAGHRDTFFRALRNIKKNDLIRFETLEGGHAYRVDTTSIVQPDDVAVLKSGNRSQLTLVTCYPFYYVGSAPERFIVSAHEVKAEEGLPELREVRTEEVQEEPAQPSIGETVIGETAISAKVIRTKEAGAEVLPPVIRAEGQTGRKTISFSILANHSREIAPGISLGLSETEASTGSADGWIWVMPDRRTVRFRNQTAGEPLVFYQDGQRRELLIESVSRDAITASLLLAAE